MPPHSARPVSALMHAPISVAFDSLRDAATTILSPHGPARAAAQASYTPGDLSAHFFLQLAVILIACRVTGWLGRRFLAQPQVVGEMIAGVLLGPSLFGLVAPAWQAAIFPPATRDMLYVGAQLGVALYMFLVGLTLDREQLATKWRAAAAVSGAGLVAPFVFAALLAPSLLAMPGLFAEGRGRPAATLFLGACIALTAFPMLARIITERGLAGTPLGTLALAAGAFDDAASWCVLAIVLAAFGGGAGGAVLAIGGAILWVTLLTTAGRRLFAPLAHTVGDDGRIAPGTIAVALTVFAVSAFVMDAIGIHGIFGGFIAGAVMPRGRFADALRRALEPLTVTMLLPLFFTYSGLNTRLDLLAALPLLAAALAILLASVAAKFGACWLAARLAGEDNRTALGIGALMNARGLMELIIVNIGLQKGVIGPALFSMLVLMAVVTTMMAGPLFDLVERRHGRLRSAPVSPT